MRARSRFRLAAGRRALAVAVLLALGGCGGGQAPATGGGEAEIEAVAPWFTEITTESGLDFVFSTGAAGELYMPETVSGGCALFDADGDGDLDIYLANGNGLLPSGDTATEPVNALFLQGADGRFTEAGAAAGLADGGYGMGLGTGDIDNDGDLDVYVANFGRDHLYRNRGDGTFEEIGAEAGVNVEGWSSSVAFLDFDADGLLDIFVTQYVILDAAAECRDGAGRRDYCGPMAFEPLSDLLFRGLGGGRFENVSESAGLASAAAAGLGVVCGDYDGDGDIDAYVANDGWDNHLWMNQGDGSFRNTALARGAAYNMRGQAEAGMGLVADDLDGDGHEDFFITHLAAETNTFLRNMGGRAVYDDRTGKMALGTPSLPFTGFGVVALDLELDRDLDLVVVNGGVRRGDPPPGADLSRGIWAELAQPNQVYLNDGSGSYSLTNVATGGLREQAEVSRGLIAGDIDGDGDGDLLVTNLEGPARLFRNDVPRAGHWLTVRAELPELHRDAVGARVFVHLADTVLTRTIRSGLSYQSAGPLIAHFGLGESESVESFEVRWPGGVRERFAGGPADRQVTLRRGEGEVLP